MKKLRILMLLMAIMSWGALSAQGPYLRLPSLIGDNMVLQRNTTVKIWGWSDPGSTIKIAASWTKDTVKVKAKVDSRWEVSLKTNDAPGVHTMFVTNGKANITVKNILLGEVWLCSGQSNMNRSGARGMVDMKEELTKPMSDSIRLFQVQRGASLVPLEEVDGKWEVCDAKSAEYFTAVGYFFGRTLLSGLQRPVGLIHSSWGGSPAEVWTPADQLPDTAKATFKKQGTWTNPEIGAGGLYNFMIAPLTKTAIKGAIWYQGEANVSNAGAYDQLMKAMVLSWRAKFGKDMPFYFVQIAPYKYSKDFPRQAALLREKQEKMLSILPNMGMISTMDLIDTIGDIHPTHKRPVGVRLAKWALAETYGVSVGKYKSPAYASMAVEKKGIRISFNNAEGGLVVKGDKVLGLEIADASMNFVPAEGKLDKKTNTLLVFAKGVKAPVAVRYCYTNTGVGNIFDTAGLPLLAFRTDAEFIPTRK